MPDEAATGGVVPVGSDLRVVARVRMGTLARGVAELRVAMRVQVTGEDEDLRSLKLAIQRAVRALLLVAMMVAVLGRGVVRRVACAVASVLAPVPVVFARTMSWPVVVESQRTPRPALAASVIPSPD